MRGLFGASLISVVFAGSAITAERPLLSSRDQRIATWLSDRLGADGGTETFSSRWKRLNNAPHDVAVVYVEGRMVCGSGGCNMYVLEDRPTGVRMRAETTITRLPISKLKTRSRGWNDLAVDVGGGGVSPHRVRLRFDGWKYFGNPSMAPTLARHVSEEMLITSESTKTPIQ